MRLREFDETFYARDLVRSERRVVVLKGASGERSQGRDSTISGRSSAQKALLLCSATVVISQEWFPSEVRRGADSSLAGCWSSGIDRSDGCGLRDVQRGRSVAAACAGGDLEQRVVSTVGVCGDQLHAKLGIRVLRGAGFVDWRVSVDELSATWIGRDGSSRTEGDGVVREDTPAQAKPAWVSHPRWHRGASTAAPRRGASALDDKEQRSRKQQIPRRLKPACDDNKEEDCWTQA